MIRRTLLALLVLAFAACTGAPPVIDGPGLTGRYVVNGFDPNGFEYSGLVEVATVGDTDQLFFHWLITGAELEGTGTPAGDRLEVSWEAVNPAGTTGIVTYSIESDGRLVGVLTIDGVDGEGTEELFPEP